MKSLTDRTLDQQCTVTRPGVAAIASALLVEVLVSLIQHPLGAAAPAPASSMEDRGNNPLGLVPHQVRGYVSNFQNILIKGRSYDCCSACSDRITGAFKSEGWQFVRKALNDKGFVEELSGLAEVRLMSLSTIKRLTHGRFSDQRRKRWQNCNGAMTRRVRRTMKAR